MDIPCCAEVRLGSSGLLQDPGKIHISSFSKSPDFLFISFHFIIITIIIVITTTLLVLCGLVALAHGERAEPDIKITRWKRRPGNWKSESMKKKSESAVSKQEAWKLG